jgi:hypothetical protein
MLFDEQALYRCNVQLLLWLPGPIHHSVVHSATYSSLDAYPSSCLSDWLQEVEAPALSRKGLKQTKAYKASKAALRDELRNKKQQRLQQDIEATAAPQETLLPLATGPEPSSDLTDKMDAVSGAAVEGGDGTKGQAVTWTIALVEKFIAENAWAFLHLRGSATADVGVAKAVKQVDAAADELAPTRGKFSTVFKKAVIKTKTFFGSCFAPSVQAE